MKVGESVSLFLGQYNFALDAKNRLNIPTKFLSCLSKKIYISIGFENSLEIRNENDYLQYAKSLLSINNSNKDARHVQDYFFANSSQCEVDSSNRILLPQNLIDKIKISKNVVVMGAGDKIKIWDESTYKKYISSNEKTYEVTADKISHDIKYEK